MGLFTFDRKIISPSVFPWGREFDEPGFNGLRFEYTGEVQTVTLPAGTYVIHCYGAGGGSRYIPTRSNGGYVKGTVTFNVETLLNMYVGKKGGHSDTGEMVNVPGGWNGGGAGGMPYTASHIPGASGGGATDIRVGRTALANRIIVAGGGGGSSGLINPINSSNAYGGGGGGGGYYGGGGGGGGTSTSGDICAGLGGTQSAGGTGGTGNGTGSGQPGALGVGGAGGNNNYASTIAGSTSRRGGDGGGLTGGRAYGTEANRAHGGGGGSSYADAGLFSGVVHTQGINNGDGFITIIKLS